MNLGILTTLWKRFWPMKNSRNSSSGDASNQQQRCLNPTPVSLETETLTTNGFESYCELNDQLLKYILSGAGNSDKADAIRDQMDDHWYKMSNAQQDAIRKHNEQVLG